MLSVFSEGLNPVNIVKPTVRNSVIIAMFLSVGFIDREKHMTILVFAVTGQKNVSYGEDFCCHLLYKGHESYFLISTQF